MKSVYKELFHILDDYHLQIYKEKHNHHYD